jgi:hypothetical protein
MPLSMVFVAVTVILTAVVEVPRLGAGPTIANAADIQAAFRDLPTAVLTGDILKVEVDTPNDSTCDGSVIYRDNTEQKLKPIDETEGRCRWSVIVPENVRRGEADVYVTVNYKEERTTLRSTIDVVRGVENIGVVLRELPGNVKRMSDFSIRLDVPDKSTCQGAIAYEDGVTQQLLPQLESKERCRWDLTVPANAPRGTARVNISITAQDGQASTLVTSFEVAREKDGADMLVALKDLPAIVHRDTSLPIRVLVPVGAKCTGEITFRSAPNVDLEETAEQSGLCRWSVEVPPDARRGDSDLTVKVTSDGKEATLKALVAVDESPAYVDANFKDLPGSIRRGDDLEVRVSVPDGASCQGDVTFDDGVKRLLDSQVEKRDRCLWSVGVASQTPRGPAVVRVWVDDHGQRTTLTSNVMVEGREDDPLTGFWESVPREAKPGEKFEVAVNVASGSSCVGKIEFPEGMRWTLGDRTEDDAYCRWQVEVPTHIKTGKAQAEVKIEKNGKVNTLHADIEVKGQQSTTSSARVR